MTPYYSDSQVTIVNAETLSMLATMLSESGGAGAFDLIMADPPYGETSIQWDRWQPEFPNFVRPHIKEGGSMWCFGSLRMFMENAIDFRDWKMSQEIVWEKQNGTGFFNDRFRRVHELVAHFYARNHTWASVYKNPQFTMDATKRTVRRKGMAAHWQGERGPSSYVSQDGGPRLMRSVLQFKNMHGIAEHPTQKPEGLVRTLMRYSLPPGGAVLIPYMGSGTDVVVARELGASRIVAIEGREDFCEIAVRRLQQAVLPLEIPA